MVIGWLGGLATALPAIIVAAYMLFIVADERSGPDYAAASPFRNSAEAAAAGDAARMLRFLRMGDNPTRIHPIRPGLISSQVLKVTTLEAAMWSRQIGMIRALDREGAIVDSDQRRDLACLALDLGLPDVANYLSPDQQCVRGAAVGSIIARSMPEAAGHD